MATRKQLFKLVFYIGFVIGLFPTANAQQKSNFSLCFGANINNPHQLLENSNNPNDVNTINNNQKAVGNMWVGLCYKNLFQIGINNELNGTSFTNTNADLYITSRVYLLNENFKIKPYLETGILINSYGNISILREGLLGYLVGTGFTVKLNKTVKLDLGLGYTYKEFKYQILARPTDLPTEITIDRFMIRTGLIFKIL